MQYYYCITILFIEQANFQFRNAESYIHREHWSEVYYANNVDHKYQVITAFPLERSAVQTN